MNQLWIWVVDSAYQPIDGAQLRATTRRQNDELDIKYESDHWVVEVPDDDQVRIDVVADGFDEETHIVRARDEFTQVVIGLRQPGERSYTYGDNRLSFKPTDEVFLLSVAGEGATRRAQQTLKRAKLTSGPVDPEAPEADDNGFLRIEASFDEMRELLSKLEDDKTTVEFYRAIEHGDRPALGLSNELVASFGGDLDRSEVERQVERFGLRVEREVRHLGNGFLLTTKDGPNYELLEIADALAASEQVVYVEPNLTFQAVHDAWTPNDPLFSQVPHLPLIGADEAWDLLDDVNVNLRGGSPSICVAVTDIAGVAPNHPDLTANLTDGASKMLSSTNFASTPIAAQTVATLNGDHGTQCAASAVAAFDDNQGIPGVAPNCRLIGTRQSGFINAVAMADKFLWLAGFMNGSTTAGFPAAPPTQPADVISSSWGANGVVLSNTARAMFDFLTTYGRGGKGCVVVWSLGNNGYLDFTVPTGVRHRAWPTYARCIGVGASINTNPTNPIPSITGGHPTGQTVNVPAVVDTRTYYSPYGQTALQKPDLVSPSHSAYSPALVDPILSAVRVGTGTIDGCTAGVCMDYDTGFGGTSHAAPTVAGASALILSADPTLNWVQVRDLFRATSARIDAAQTNAIGVWQDLDTDGTIDYSRWYGAGRLDVEAAITSALDLSRPLSDVYVRENLSDIGDVPSSGNWWRSPDIWVREDASEAIPTLAWTDPAPHENAVRGQDNAVFMRVRNRGTGVASTVRMRALVTHWAGLEFVYPDDWQPTTNVGAAIPTPMVPGTYLIGEQVINNLAPASDQIVKVTWPSALIPPETVTVGAVTVNWHPCLLLEASPHDGPAPIGGLSVPVQGNNNIAQRNITIVNAASGDSDSFVGFVAGTRDKAGVATLVIDPSLLKGAKTIGIAVANRSLAKALAASAQRVAQRQPKPKQRFEPTIVLEDSARVRFDPGLDPGGRGQAGAVLQAAAGSRVLMTRQREGFRVDIVERGELSVVVFEGLEHEVEIPWRLEGGHFVPLAVRVEGEPRGDLRLTQRRGDGEFAGGYGVTYAD